MSRREERATELIAHEAAKWIAEEASTQSMITVTRAVLVSKGDRALVYVSVFPEQEARPALAFLERMRGEFRTHLATKARLHPLPSVEFILDTGEENRRRLDELSNKS